MGQNEEEAKTNKKPKKSALKISIGIAIAVVVAIGVGALIKNAADISRLHAQLADSDEKYSEQVEENTRLKEILESDDKDAYMEQKAREEDYIKDNEIKLHDVGSNE